MAESERKTFLKEFEGRRGGRDAANLNTAAETVARVNAGPAAALAGDAPAALQDTIQAGAFDAVCPCDNKYSCGSVPTKIEASVALTRSPPHGPTWCLREQCGRRPTR